MSTPINTCDMNRKWVRTYGPIIKKRHVFQAQGVGRWGRGHREGHAGGCPAGIQSQHTGGTVHLVPIPATEIP